MPEIKTRADSLREYLTGANSDGGTQTNPNLSLGDYRSSTEAVSMLINIINPVFGLQVTFAAGGNTPGVGTLKAVDANTIQWKCAGGEYGPQVTITNGQSKIVETSGLPGAYIRVTRVTTADMYGTASIALSPRMNNVFAMDDVSSAEATAGDINYRATIIKNESVATVLSFKRWIGELGTSQVSGVTQLGASGAGTIKTAGNFNDWPDQGWCHIKNGEVTREIVYYSERNTDTLTIPATGRARLGTTAGAGAATDTIHAVPGIAVGLEPGGVDSTGAIQAITNESTAPIGVTWKTGITADTGLSVSSVDPGDLIGVWFKREIPQGAVANTLAKVLIEDSFEAA